MPDNAVFKVGVVGLRGVGKSHMRAINACPNTELYAVCDIDEGVLEERAAEYCAPRRTTRFLDMVEMAELDIITLCTPDRMHAEQALAALEAGKHCFIEKPLCTSVEDAQAIVEAAYKRNLKTILGNNARFTPQFIQQKKIVDSGVLGPIFFAEGNYIHDMRHVYSKTPWRVDPDVPQNPLLGGGVHPMDLMRWNVGEVEEVHAFGNHFSLPEWPGINHYICSLKFENGAVGKLWVPLGIRFQPACITHCNLYGENGTVLASNGNDNVRMVLAETEPVTDMIKIPVARVGRKPYEEMYAHFADCIVEDRTALIDAYDGAKTVAVLVAGIESSEMGGSRRVREIILP